jgi:transposase
MPAGLAMRARIVLAGADGESNTAVAERLGITRQTVVTWRARYVADGVRGLEDRARSGRPRVVDPLEVVVTTMQGPPKRLGVTHWSSRLLAAELGISNVAVANIWREHRLQPWRTETFKFSTDPELDAKVRDVVGLYLAPPAKAVVVCVDEKSQIQAPDRTAPMLPLVPGLPERRTHDYKRAGTTTLFAALEVATGRITADACYERHRRQEFLAFLKQVAKAHPRVELHVVCDNYATHKTPEVTAWLARHPRITLHFTPTSGSWLNMVEIFVGIITRQAIRRGTFRSVHELTGAIRRFIDAYNQRATPFVWTKTADKILAHARPTQP